MTEDPEQLSLPRLPSERNSIPDPFPGGIRNIKRSRVFSSPTISSDPPLFSSDDDPAAENYVSRDRVKRRFRGPWYKQHGADGGTTRGGRTKRTFQRQKDSAIFMGSDATDSDADFSATLPVSNVNAGQGKLAFRPTMPSQAEMNAQKIIQNCLDGNLQQIDLSNCNLEKLSTETIRPLRTLLNVANIRSEAATRLGRNTAPSIGHGPVHEQRQKDGVSLQKEYTTYEHLHPRIQLYLSRNVLRRISGEIFNLPSLTVLSLRGNKLVELPAAISRPKFLEELNVSNNQLHYLPYELLSQFHPTSRLTNLSLGPNCFYLPHIETHTDSLDTSLSSHNASHTSFSHPQGFVFDSISPIFQVSPSPSHQLPTFRQPPGKGGYRRIRTWREAVYTCRSQVRYFSPQGVLLKGPALQRDSLMTVSRSLNNQSDAGSKHKQGDKLGSSGNGGIIKIPVALAGDIPSPPTPQLQAPQAAASTARYSTSFHAPNIAPSVTSKSPTPALQPTQQSRVPSLTELALKAWTRLPQSSPHRQNMRDYLAEESYGLDRIAVLQEESDVLLEQEGAGGRNCTICGRKGMLIPRTEWIEWFVMISPARKAVRDVVDACAAWQATQTRLDTTNYLDNGAARSSSTIGDSASMNNSSGLPYNSADVSRIIESAQSAPLGPEDRWGGPTMERLLPFLRRGCSWGCVPPMVEEIMAMGTET